MTLELGTPGLGKDPCVKDEEEVITLMKPPETVPKHHGNTGQVGKWDKIAEQRCSYLRRYLILEPLWLISITFL